MVLSFSAWLIVLGILGAKSAIIGKKPEMKGFIDKILPYEGWFGAASVFYGAWDVFSCVTSMGLMAVKPPIGLIYWILYLLNGLLQIGLGLLLGIGILKTWVKDATAQAKMDQTREKLIPYQGTLGFLAIAVGLAFTVINFIL